MILMEPIIIKEKINTVHTSRTIMHSELSKVMDHGFETNSFVESLLENVTGKLTKSNIKKTNRYLKQLYGFDENDAFFKGFKYFWKLGNSQSKPILALQFAIHTDDLLAESVDLLCNKSLGNKLTVNEFEENLSHFHPNKYSAITSRSIAKNIASSWKQAGLLLGKLKNIRVQPDIDFIPVAFALYLGYLDNLRGEFLFNSKYTRALSLPENKLRELAFEASKRDLLSYQYAGSVTTVTFNQLFKKLNING